MPLLGRHPNLHPLTATGSAAKQWDPKQPRGSALLGRHTFFATNSASRGGQAVAHYPSFLEEKTVCHCLAANPNLHSLKGTGSAAKQWEPQPTAWFGTAW